MSTFYFSFAICLVMFTGHWLSRVPERAVVDRSEVCWIPATFLGLGNVYFLFSLCDLLGNVHWTLTITRSRTGRSRLNLGLLDFFIFFKV